jgi:hypothetical protein
MNLARTIIHSTRAARSRARTLVNQTASGVRGRAASLQNGAKEIGTVLGGLVDYYRHGDVTLDARASLLRLHCQTNGRFTDRLATIVRMTRPPRRPSPASGFLGDLSVQQQRSIVAAIARDGFYKFDRLLPEALCDEIERFAARTPTTVEGRGREPAQRVIFDPAAPISKTYRLVEEDIIQHQGMQQLMADQTMVAVAELYLRSHPMVSMVNLWWSAAFGNTPGADAAQEYHFDFDPPPIWLLFFVYLTDVGPDNGPHMFVRGSHVADDPSARPLRARGYVRIPDNDIVAAYGSDKIVELCGKRGTILAVDTRGFHKGKMLIHGHRLIAQLTYSCPPYSGAHSRKQKLPAVLHPSLASATAATPRVFDKYR